MVTQFFFHRCDSFTHFAICLHRCKCNEDFFTEIIEKNKENVLVCLYWENLEGAIFRNFKL